MTVDIPTAAFLRLHRKMRAAMNKNETPHAAMLATFEMDPSLPILGIPQLGLTPTGALFASAELPCRTSGASR